MEKTLDNSDKVELVRKRQRRAIATSLSDFERLIEPLLPKTPAAKNAVRVYKDAHRKMVEDVSTGAIDVMSLPPGMRLNGEAIHASNIMGISPHEAHPETGAAAA